MPIGKEQFLKQFTQQALDERISLFMGAGGSCDEAILTGPIYSCRSQGNLGPPLTKLALRIILY